VTSPEQNVELLLARLVVDGLVDAGRGAPLFALPRPRRDFPLRRRPVDRRVGAARGPAGDDRVAETLREVFLRANRVERGVLQGTSLRDLLGSPTGAEVVPVRLPPIDAPSRSRYSPPS